MCLVDSVSGCDVPAHLRQACVVVTVVSLVSSEADCGRVWSTLFQVVTFQLI